MLVARHEPEIGGTTDVAGHPEFAALRTTKVIAELRSSADPNGIGDLKAEIRQLFRLGLDGVFTDNPDIGVRARR